MKGFINLAGINSEEWNEDELPSWDVEEKKIQSVFHAKSPIFQSNDSPWAKKVELIFDSELNIRFHR